MKPADKQKEIFATNLNRLLELAGKQQSDMAKELNINKATVSSWCVGSRIPKMDTIQILADYFRVKKSYLIEDHNILATDIRTDIHTIAAHHNGEDWTEEELEEIEKFKEFVKSKRNNPK